MGLLETITVILLIAWIAGFTLHIAGAFIHVFLVLAVVLFLTRFLRTAIR